jgi:SAM-dependent methyltransferase
MQAQINSTKLPQIQISTEAQKQLRCPACSSELELQHDKCQCTNHDCQAVYPIKDGIPILIDTNKSIFSIEDFLSYRSIFFDLSPTNKVLETVHKLLPKISANIKGKQNYENLGKLLLQKFTNPKVLVVGGSILGEGTEGILSNPNIELVETDVSFGPRTDLICDAHSIPFADNSFDAVIVQAVLEHVVDPYLCVKEIHRVLKKDGIVYSETPFMQQVHGGCYDFTRFTYLGHRRLFRNFEEIESGSVCGTGMALAWSFQYFLWSFSSSKIWRKLSGLFVRFVAFPFKYFDYLLINKTGTFDAASGFYFIGKKSDRTLCDKELIKLYKGNF